MWLTFGLHKLLQGNNSIGSKGATSLALVLEKLTALEQLNLVKQTRKGRDAGGRPEIHIDFDMINVTL
jgi:hypothetical protein